jgi:GUN4-like
MNSEEFPEEFLIETNLGNDAILLPASIVEKIDGQKLKANVDRLISLVQQFGQNNHEGLTLEEVEVSFKITADGEIVLLGGGQSAIAPAMTLRFRQPGVARSSSVQVDSRTQLETRIGKGLTYASLEKMLAAGQWQAANRETWDLLCQSLQKNLGTPLTPADIQQIPCDIWQKIDQLWQQYSQGNFGFSVQKRSYQDAQL